MHNTFSLQQEPIPGKHIICFKGDTITFTLTLPYKMNGTAWLRTNIGHADIARQEALREVHYEEHQLGRDWYDIPMRFVDDLTFKIKLGLSEVGHFKAKCLFVKESEQNPLWPEGDNTVINVQPADTCCGNIIYNAFVRQFGPNKEGDFCLNFNNEEQWIKTLDKKGYAVIPPSGTFRDVIKELDFIIGELGCRIIQFLPIHPTPTTYGRMGRFGSPYASLSFTSVDPALAIFDPKATPLEQFIELVDAIHGRNAKVLMDIAINHTGWAADLHERHPEWLMRDPMGQIEVPGAWGVKWEDLTSLDYRHKNLWQYMAEVFLTWCRRGIDGFRCDAGYMIPISAWKYITASVREQYPNTIFFLEGLGGPIPTTRDILNRTNFNWAYSELFQNYDRNQIEYYLPSAIEISKNDGIMVNYAETHDNSRLALRSTKFAQMRTALCALFAPYGAFGFANGVEWFATEKIDVHGSPSLNWGSAKNQIKEISILSQILKNHPCFNQNTELELIQKGGGNQLVLLRHNTLLNKKLLILVNLEDINETISVWDNKKAQIEALEMMDILTGQKIKIKKSDDICSYAMEPCQILCLTYEYDDLDLIKKDKNLSFNPIKNIENQYFKAKVLEVLQYYNDTKDLGQFDIEKAVIELKSNPLEFCRSINPFNEEPRAIVWKWPRDIKREIMVPPNNFLLVIADIPFRCNLMDKNRNIFYEESLTCEDGSFFVLFKPIDPPNVFKQLTLKLCLYTRGSQALHADFPLLYLPIISDVKIQQNFQRTEILKTSLIFLGTNKRGGMLRANISWGELNSKYDALLAANINPDYPEDRRIMFTRCRAWVVFQGYSQDISINSMDSFVFQYNSQGFWRFNIPCGQGEYVLLTVGIEMLQNENAIKMVFHRGSAPEGNGKLSDKKSIRLILRPDIEDRNFHENIKAYLGPENEWHKKIFYQTDGFTFTPEQERRLQLKISKGAFIWEPEWYYMLNRPIEAERGLDPHSDLFSPGYFSLFLKGGESIELFAKVLEHNEINVNYEGLNTMDFDLFEQDKELSLHEAMRQAMEHYIVKRGDFSTVIAGYPWFLDWGRDSLIFVRGFIAGGKIKEVKAILKQFASFEHLGTIPNMIRGKDAGNRDTSDALLWFFVACSDLITYENNDSFLDNVCGERKIRQILISMAKSLISGTPNGIKMDQESGLIFSPSHFTWMDTNYPAGTPREGYPIEIQALWYFALSFLSRIDSVNNQEFWSNLSVLVQKSILKFFWIEKEGYLADCLYAKPETPASMAQIDDALRSNQLFAITMEAIKDNFICKKILSSCEELLVPGAIRSLADRNLKRPLPIYYNNKLLNNPKNPYIGKYRGDEDTERKPAYHNGTAWTWPFPSYCEAWVKVYGDKAKTTALSWLGSSARTINRQGCIGHIPEIMDGDFPHIPRGCDAQAWGVSELYRVLMILK